MAANIINATTAGITTTGGDESILNLQTAGVTRLSIASTQALSPAAFFRESGQVVSRDYTITEGRNAYSVGPIELGPDVVVTVPDGSVWTVI
jgi:hypothetical protein